ncbi:MAG: DUF1385 domain-containing protein [Candidatus Bathyarchaeota archaeon]|nr:DUF1385 domain-containing protein [Candidatus Bathyarchaeota archaeon]
MSEEEQSFAYGGQALIEGVMMRSGTHMVMCVRQPDDEIATHTIEINSLTRKHRFLRLPFIRGMILLMETLYYGVKSIFYSADVALEEEGEEFTTKEYILVLGMVLLMNGLFIAVPYVIANFLKLEGVLFNVVESGLRLSLFILYMYTISKWDEFSRILQYHGAEHKAINAYEAGEELTPEKVAGFGNLNPRCGTSFLFITIIMSIALFSMLPKADYLMRLAYRIFLIPFIGGISYEVLKFSDKHRKHPIMQIIIKPGLAFQRLTTKEPTTDMIEVAIKALEEVIKIHED